MRTTCVSLAVLAALSMPAKAGQPIHESLVECSVLVELLLGEQSFVRGENELLDLYSDFVAATRIEAERQTSRAYVQRTAEAKRVTWHQRWDDGNWDDPANRDELVEWWTYCFKLAKHLGLERPNS